MRFAFSNPTSEAKRLNYAFSIVAAVTYVILIVIFSFGADLVPRFGLTINYLQSVGYEGWFRWAKSGKGFGNLPHPALSMGVIYFTCLAFYEIVIPRYGANIEIPEKYKL